MRYQTACTAVVVEDHARQHEVVAQQLPVRRDLDLGHGDVGLRVHRELGLHLRGVARRVRAAHHEGAGGDLREVDVEREARAAAHLPEGLPVLARLDERDGAASSTRPATVTSPFTSSWGRGERIERTGAVTSFWKGTSATVALPAASTARTARRCGPSCLRHERDEHGETAAARRPRRYRSGREGRAVDRVLDRSDAAGVGCRALQAQIGALPGAGERRRRSRGPGAWRR